MSQQSTNLNTDQGNVKTSAVYADRGDGTSTWYLPSRIFNGGDVAQGATSDAAVTNPASSGSVVALLKGLLTRLSVGAASLLKAEDAAHADGDAGVMALAVRRDTSAASSGATGDYEPLQTDSLGRLRVTLGRTGVLTNSTSTALEATRVIKASAGVLYGLQGHTNVDERYVWICNKTTAPNGTSDNLVLPIYVATAGPFSIDFGPYGRAFATGISVGISTAPTSWTGGGSNAWFDAQFE